MTELPEAPASVTYSITSKNGFNILFTVRDMTGTGLLDKMEAIELKFEKLGYKPQIKQAFGQKKEIVYVQGEDCPECGARLIEKVSKTGKKFHECEKRIYDFTTKQTTGCSFIKWL